MSLLLLFRGTPTGPAIIPLGAAAGQATATLSLSAPTQVPLATAAAQSAGTLALRAPTQVPLSASTGQSSATLLLTVPGGPVFVPLGTAAATSTGTLALTARTQIPLDPSVAVSTASLVVSSKQPVPLGSSSATSTATLVVTTPGNVAAGGKFVLTKAKVVVNGTDISQFCHDIQMDLEADEIDYTPLGSAYRVTEPGPMHGTFTLSLFADQTVITPAFWSSLDAPATITITPRSDLITAIQNPTWSATAIAVRKTELSGSAGDAAEASVELHSTGPVLVLVS